MAGSEEKDSEDEIRVVDEEEVIRLDAPENKGLEKSGKTIFEDAGPSGIPEEESSGRSPMGREVLTSGPLEDFAAEKEQAQVPMGWFYLLGMGLVGVLVWMGIQIASKDFGGGPGTEVVTGSGNGPGGDQGEERMNAEEYLRKMEAVVTAFLAADTVEERLKYVRHPKRVLPLMKDFYQSRPLKTYKFQKISRYMGTAIGLKPFIVLSVAAGENESLPILLEDSSEGVLVDWESFVCYLPILPAKYLEERPTDPVSLRVYAAPSNFYVYEFSSERDYRCFRLTFRKSDTTFYGYAKRGSEVAQKFHDVFKSSKSKEAKPLILKVRFLEDGKADRGVLIEDLESTLWAYGENPDEKGK